MQNIERRLNDIRTKHGKWTAHNIALPGGIYTIGPHASVMDIRRGDYFVEIAMAIFGEDLRNLAVLDLGCLEGGLSIQFARLDVHVDGVDIRGDSIAKARTAADILELNSLRFFEGDVLNLPKIELRNTYDIILCAGLLYHLDAKDQFPFLRSLAERCSGIIIVDTHISHEAVDVFEGSEGLILSGRFIQEGGTSAEDRRTAMWASWSNNRSFWLTEQSLSNALYTAGFSLVTKATQPTFRWPWKDRKTWIAFRGSGMPRVFQAEHLTEADNRPSEHPTVAAGRNVHV
ncbi:MAG: class I SAM-dependent methyltransferase [Candidatus Thiodiazotropha taylori]|nr:class I SAM-dependent methyltransferase [Candidatus Thiodiazotropha taylori]MCW4328205.1 class I SAM-dependent methyltransferase [Candidatus Thiodiazotropha taylori]